MTNKQILTGVVSMLLSAQAFALTGESIEPDAQYLISNSQNEIIEYGGCLPPNLPGQCN